jgi:hypothetical protein
MNNIEVFILFHFRIGKERFSVSFIYLIMKDKEHIFEVIFIGNLIRFYFAKKKSGVLRAIWAW